MQNKTKASNVRKLSAKAVAKLEKAANKAASAKPGLPPIAGGKLTTGKPTGFGGKLSGGNANPVPHANPAPSKRTGGKPSATPDAKPERVAGLTRDLRTIGTAAAHFEQLSERDEAYLRYFAEHYGTKPFRVAELLGKRNPYYAGSNKLSDGGVLGGRLQKSNMLTFDKAAGTVTLSKRGCDTGLAVAKRDGGKRLTA